LLWQPDCQLLATRSISGYFRSRCTASTHTGHPWPRLLWVELRRGLRADWTSTSASRGLLSEGRSPAPRRAKVARLGTGSTHRCGAESSCCRQKSLDCQRCPWPGSAHRAQVSRGMPLRAECHIEGGLTRDDDLAQDYWRQLLGRLTPIASRPQISTNPPPPARPIALCSARRTIILVTISAECVGSRRRRS